MRKLMTLKKMLFFSNRVAGTFLANLITDLCRSMEVIEMQKYELILTLSKLSKKTDKRSRLQRKIAFCMALGVLNEDYNN